MSFIEYVFKTLLVSSKDNSIRGKIAINHLFTRQIGLLDHIQPIIFHTKMSIKNLLSSILLILSLASCGSVSKVIVTEPNSAAQNSLKDRKYQTVIMGEFTLSDNFESSLQLEDQRKEVPSKYKSLVYSRLSSDFPKKGITIINTSKNDSKETLNPVLLTGEIKQFEDGNSFLRALIGFGAGRGKFDCDLSLIDMKTRKKVGVIEVRKASWLLGGSIASSHDATMLMHMSLDGVSENVAEAITNN